MSFIIQAPYPKLVSTLLLPSPVQSNNQNLQSTIQTVRSMNGTVYTYVKAKRGRKKYSWSFTTSKDKALESKEFVSFYAQDLVKIVDHEEVLRIGWIIINPLEQRGEGRAGGWGKNEEAYAYTIEFEERV